MRETLVKSPLNYTGGKYRLLPQILPLFPDNIETFVDLFCGGANVGVNINAKHVIYNDYNQHLIGLFNVLKKYDYETAKEFIEATIGKYQLSDSAKNGYEFYGCESSSGLGSYNKPHFISMRNNFNAKRERDDDYYLLLYTLMIYSFNNQIRFNSKGEFNLPVGKRDFNLNIRKNLKDFIEVIHEQDCEFISEDFRKLDSSYLSENDFVYCDPPYLITTASYNESNGWTTEDEKALLSFLDKLNDKNVRFALSNVTRHKGKTNELLLEWAEKYTTNVLNYQYSNSNYHGKNKDKITEEVLIVNY